MTKQQAISFVMVPKMKKVRMSKHHNLEFLLMNLKQTVQQLQAKKKRKDEVSNNQVADFHSYSAKEKKTI